MAVSIRKRHERARKRYDTAVDAVYAAAPNDLTPFSGCLAAASMDVQTELNDARMALWDIEQEAVNAGKAYYASVGGFTWYRRT